MCNIKNLHKLSTIFVVSMTLSVTLFLEKIFSFFVLFCVLHVKLKLVSFSINGVLLNKIDRTKVFSADKHKPDKQTDKMTSEATYLKVSKLLQV